MKKLLVTAMMLCCAGMVMAQKIDFNNSSDRTEDGYTAWPVGIESTLEKTVDGITFTILTNSDEPFTQQDYDDIVAALRAVWENMPGER